MTARGRVMKSAELMCEHFAARRFMRRSLKVALQLDHLINICMSWLLWSPLFGFSRYNASQTVAAESSNWYQRLADIHNTTSNTGQRRVTAVLSEDCDISASVFVEMRLRRVAFCTHAVAKSSVKSF